MVPLSSNEDFERRYEGVLDDLLKSLTTLKLEPKIVPSGRIDWLRGGVSCIELKSERCVEAAVLMTNYAWERVSSRDSPYVYKVDYALRGNVSNVLPGRILSRTILKLGGLMKKKLIDLQWIVPNPELKAETTTRYPSAGIYGSTPGPGELWEGGPYQRLTEALNQDDGLKRSLNGFVERGGGAFMSLHIFTDTWGESIRIAGDLWTSAEELPDKYANESYLGIVALICGHVKELRRQFGGISF